MIARDITSCDFSTSVQPSLVCFRANTLFLPHESPNRITDARMTTPGPIVLYRSLLRAHRKYLPSRMRALGDSYVQQEFRLHRNAKEEHLDGFIHEWEKYLQQITMTARAQESIQTGTLDADKKNNTAAASQTFQYGSNLPLDAALTDEQVVQLEKLREEIDKFS